MTTIIQNFTLVSLTSTVTPYSVKLPLGAAIFSFPRHSSPYTLVFLRTCLVTYLSPYALVSLRTCFSTYLSPYALVSLRNCLPTHLTSHDGKEEWQRKMIRKDDNVSSYSLDHLHLTPHCLRSWKVFPAVGTTCVSSTCSGIRLIIFWSVNRWRGIELLVRCN